MKLNRTMVADTAAMILFSTALGLFIEVVVSGLTLVQSLEARAASIPINLLTGRPYGWFRDRLFVALKLNRTSFVGGAIGDTMAFVLFQMPLYFIVLSLAGATWVQIITAATTFSLFLAGSGRVYGLFLDYCRRLIGAVESPDRSLIRVLKNTLISGPWTARQIGRLEKSCNLAELAILALANSA